jgi:hypothetical protein
MMSKPLAALLFVACLTPPAFADDFEVGARVGGYGFRRDGQEEWTECRMNGFGVFGGAALRGPLFVEAGIDMYNSLEPTLASDLPIDRTSGLFSAAIGARTQVATWLRGYVQLGGGLELTRVSVPYGDERIRDTKPLPEAFFGIGLDIKLAKGTHLGTSFRTLVMGNFDYEPARLEMTDEWAWKPSADVVFDASPDVAAQVQFYVRREL